MKMTENTKTLPLQLTVGQITAIQSRLSRHTQMYQELVLLSCEMFSELYKHDKNSPLLERWNQMIKNL